MLKNIAGAPIPFLWTLLPFGFFVGLPAGHFLAMAIAACTAIYILIDRFSTAPEFRFFRLGIEIPLFLLLLVQMAAVWLSPEHQFGTDSLSLFSWFVLLYLLTYSLNLFPGLNRIFVSLFMAATFYAGFSLAKFYGLVDFSLFPALDQASSSLATGLAPHIHAQAFVLAIGLLYCMSFFVFRKRLWSASAVFFLVSAIVLFAALLVTGQALAYLALVLPYFLYVLLVSKKWLKHSVISALMITAAISILSYFPKLEERVFPSQLKKESLLEKEYWRGEFETLPQRLWLGKDRPWFHTDLSTRAPSANEIFSLESNSYLFLLTQKGLLYSLCFLLLLLTSLFLSLRLLSDIPYTHNWHKVFALFLISFQIFGFAYGMELRIWSSAQGSAVAIALNAIVFYMVEAYGRQIVPDDKSL